MCLTHQWVDIIPWFFSRSYRGTWNVCLVNMLDPSFVVAGRWLRGGRTAWYGSGIVGMMCRSSGVTRLTFARSVITFSLFVSWIVPLWPATTFCSYFLFLQVLLCYISVIAYVFCHTGVLVCLFVVNVANFCYAVIENRLSTSKLHYEFTVLYFWLLSFVWDPSTSFQSHFCCSYCFVYSFLFGICLCRLLLWSVFVWRNGTTDFAKTGQVSDDTINLINC